MRLKQLTRLHGVSGHEQEVRTYLLKEAGKLADEAYIDDGGNVVAIKRGTDEKGARIMVCAHMDEVGLIVTGVEDSGLLRFAPVGGMDLRILPCTHVLVGDTLVPGVVGLTAVHLLKKEEMAKPVALESLYIDIGAESKEEALTRVQPGDYISFDSECIAFGEGRLKAKSLDDRVGCSLLLNALEERYPSTLMAVFSCREEVGSFGAMTAAYALEPDAALVLEGTTCADMHEVPEHMRITRPGRGPALSVMDHSAIADQHLREFLEQTAGEEGIPWQYREGIMGGTDAGGIQLTGSGVPVVNINVPCRYIHSPVSVVVLEDYENAGKLLMAALRRMEEHIKNRRDSLGGNL